MNRGGLWDSRRLGQSSGTHLPRFLARDLCSFLLAPTTTTYRFSRLKARQKGDTGEVQEVL